MLVLARKLGEQALIGDGFITVTVLEIEGGQVKLGFDAPRELPIHRKEIQERIERKRATAVT